MFLKQHPYELPFKMECFDNFLHFSLILHHIMFLEHNRRKQVVKKFYSLQNLYKSCELQVSTKSS